MDIILEYHVPNYSQYVCLNDLILFDKVLKRAVLVKYKGFYQSENYSLCSSNFALFNYLK